MNAVGRIGSYISRSVYTVSAPFHPFGGAVDIIVVEQQDGSFKSSPWYVRFGKFQGVLKAKEKVVSISVNGVDADFSMFLDHKGEAYFLRDVDFEDLECSPPSSSGDDTDGQSRERRKSYDSYDSTTSLTKIEVSNGKVLSRTNSKRSRIMGLVFGRRPPVKVENVGEEEVDGKSDGSVDRSESMERAEMAADLLEVKWSTNLASPRSKKESVSEACSLQNSESKDSEGSRLKHEGSDETIGSSDGSILCNGGNEQDTVETVQTNGLVCEVNSEGEIGFRGKEPLIIGDALENQDAVRYPCDENALENVTYSPHSLGNNFVSETYSQTVTLQPVYDSEGGIESQSILTISTLTSASSRILPEQTGLQEGELTKCDPQVKPLDVLTSEISEEEHLLFGDFDDLKFSSAKDREEPVSPKSDKSDVKEGDPLLLNIELEENFTGKLKSISSQINIPAMKEQSDKELRVARSLPIMSSNSHSFCANDSESLSTSHITRNEKETNDQESHSGRTAEDGLTAEAASSTTDPAIGATTSDIVPEDREEVSKSKGNHKKLRSICPTSKQIASLNLKGGSNSIIFTFSTQMLGKQQVDARIYLWKWDARVVISDVDGTITRSDLLGQVMPWVGVDWSHIGVTHLFSAIKENGYQLLFLSARAISQAYLTRQFLFNLKQDGKVLPEGPVVISPDGLFPSLYREVVRRAPHEFKIACLEEIKALFPADRNPFYAGFGNRDTDEISYLKVGIPKGKIFIINPKGEVVVNRRVDKKSYTSLHTLVHDMFPSTVSYEQEDYNSRNYWKLPDPFGM